jgi:hypothetical protein
MEANATIGHGLGSAPAWIITKNRTEVQQLGECYHIVIRNSFWNDIINSNLLKDD